MTFGSLYDKDQLLGHLAKASYSAERLKAMECKLDQLMLKGFEGAINFRGKFCDKAAATGSSAHTEEMPCQRLADYRAFDITTDGLRYGNGLMWLPDTGHEADNDLRYTYKTSQRPEHYVDVLVDFARLKRVFKSGALPQLSDPKLNRWWEGLSDSVKMLGEDQQKEMLKTAFPNNHVSRARLRKLREETPRKRGRPAKSP